MDLLLQSSESGAQLSNQDIRDEVDLIMFAVRFSPNSIYHQLVQYKLIFMTKIRFEISQGHETTANAMTWFLYCMARHPKEQDLVMDELKHVFARDWKRPCTNHDLTELKYLECCIKETLRMYPSVPFIMRCLAENVEIGTCSINIFM